MRTKIWVPLTEQIQKAMEVAETSIEAADYLVVRLTEILTQAKLLDKSAALLQQVEDYANYVKFKLNSSAQAWFGEEAQGSDFKNMQANLAKNAVDAFKAAGIEGDLHLDFAISDKGELIRGYSVDGQALSGQPLVQLDKIFNANLTDAGLITKDSKLYQADDRGEIIPNLSSSQEQSQHKGALIKANFGNYMQSKGIPVTIQQHEYPDNLREKEEKAAVTKAVETLVETVQKEATETQTPQQNR